MKKKQKHQNKLRLSTQPKTEKNKTNTNTKHQHQPSPSTSTTLNTKQGPVQQQGTNPTSMTPYATRNQYGKTKGWELLPRFHP